MKVCQVGSGIVHIPPEGGGAVERVILNVSDFLKDRHKVEILDFLDSDVDKREGNNPEITRLETIKIHPIVQKYQFGRRCREYIRENEFDAVHIHTVFSGFPVRKVDAKIVYTSHNPDWTRNEISLANRFVRKIEKKIMDNADVVVAVSRAQKEGMSKEGYENVRVIHNSVDIPRKEFTKDKEVILFVGKHTEKKGFDIFKSMSKILPQYNFISIGPEGRFGENGGNPEVGDVTKMGEVEEEKKVEMLNKADVVVCPTDREGHSLVQLEAQSVGTPVVATDIPPCREAINNGVTGILTDRKPISMANAVEKIVEEDWKSEREEEFELWMKRFSKDRIGKKWRRIYNGL